MWDGHSCPTPLTLILYLILTLTLIPTGKGMASAVPQSATKNGTRLQPLRETALIQGEVIPNRLKAR
jgi:hypothetical protein